MHRFDPAGFDVAISRFGTMFFSDPAAAFANIAAALRPEARLVLLVWQPHDQNGWARAIDAALGDAARPPRPGADPFSLGDVEATAGILEGAGFDAVRFEDIHEPVFYGRELDAALAVVRGFQDTAAALARLSESEAARTVERLRETLAAHYKTSTAWPSIRVPGWSRPGDAHEALTAEELALEVQHHIQHDAPGKGSPLGCRRPHGRTSPAGSRSAMDTTRRGNYDSGEDFVLEYGELRFTFNERDFAERCEQAALKLGFVSGRLDEPELEDLVNLAVNGEIHEPASALGEHVNDCWPELVGPSDRSLVHWLRRLVFRSAWLDQRVKEGELDVALRARRARLPLRPARPRRRARRAGARALLGPGRLPAALSRSASRPRRAPAAIASAPASPTSSSGRSVPLATRSSAGKLRAAVQRWRRAR